MFSRLRFFGYCRRQEIGVGEDVRIYWPNTSRLESCHCLLHHCRSYISSAKQSSKAVCSYPAARVRQHEFVTLSVIVTVTSNGCRMCVLGGVVSVMYLITLKAVI